LLLPFRIGIFIADIYLANLKKKEVLMNFIEKIESWGDKHHSKWLDILRIILGLILFLKGFYFINHNDELNNMIQNSKAAIYPEILVHYVALAQLFGGVLIMIGLVTRLAILFQLPVLIGAIAFVDLRNGLLTFNNSDLPLAIIVLFLLIFFLIDGSGPISMDAYLKRNHPDDL
jgi:putative oxidoreductase